MRIKMVHVHTKDDPIKQLYIQITLPHQDQPRPSLEMWKRGKPPKSTNTESVLDCEFNDNPGFTCEQLLAKITIAGLENLMRGSLLPKTC